MHCVVAQRMRQPTTIALEELRVVARGSGIRLVTTSEGNWGRAVARMGGYLGVEVEVWVPWYM